LVLASEPLVLPFSDAGMIGMLSHTALPMSSRQTFSPLYLGVGLPLVLRLVGNADIILDRDLMWMMATQSSANINALHRQIVMFALALNAMQVEVAVEQLSGTSINLQELGRVLALITLTLLAFITFALLLLFLYLFVDEWQYAIRDKLRKGVVKEPA